jgi:hypothetical protein
MRKNGNLKLSIFALICSITVVLLGAVPLFDRHNDAQILMIFTGSFAAGIALRDIIYKIREQRAKEADDE